MPLPKKKVHVRLVGQKGKRASYPEQKIHHAYSAPCNTFPVHDRIKTKIVILPNYSHHLARCHTYGIKYVQLLIYLLLLFLCPTTCRPEAETVHRTVTIHCRIDSHGWSKSGHSRSRADAISSQRRQRCLTEPFHFICNTKGIT